MKLIGIQQTINSITGVWPEKTKDLSSDDGVVTQYVANFMRSFNQAYPEQTGLKNIVDITFKEGSEDDRSLLDKAIDYVNPTKPFKLINDIFEGVTEGMVEVFKQGGNPITTAQAIGDILIGAAWAILTAGLIMSIPTLGGAMMLAVPFGFGLLALGGMLSIMIPLSPYLMWVACVFSWFVGVVMAIIGAPLWAVAHLNPDQDGIVGKTGQGYMLILQLFLKPSLMVIGFLCALMLAVPFGDFVGATFVEALKLSQSTSSTGMGVVTAIFGAIAFYALMRNVVQRAFSLIFLLPDQILEWLGAGLPRLGADAAQISGSIDQSVSSGMSQTAGMVRKGAEGLQARYKKRAGGDLRQAADNLKNEGDRLAMGADDTTQAPKPNKDDGNAGADFGSLYKPADKKPDDKGGQS